MELQWLGFGFSMSNVDIIVAEMDLDKIIFSDRWSEKRKSPLLDNLLRGQNDIIPLG